MILDLNGIFSFPPTHLRWVLIKLNSGVPISASQPRKSFFATCGDEWIKLLIYYAFCNNTGNPGRSVLGDNCCNKAVSLSY